MINKKKQKQMLFGGPNCREKNWTYKKAYQKTAFAFLVLSMSLYTYAQEGIQWAKLSGWEEVIIKAKEENKYIFVDCYTTWCGPCKKMDETTFNNSQVGDFFKEKFIALKIQMDSTKMDQALVKVWYKDAARVQKEYFVFSFPTSLFFNPQGELVEKITGYKKDKELIRIAQESLKPGKKYEDPFKQFYVLLEKYNNGIKEYQQFPYMINTAKKIRQSDLATRFANELHKYLLTLTNNELLNRDYIEFITEYENVNNKNSDNNLSRIFYTDGEKVNAIMKNDNYSKMALNEMIRRGYVRFFLDEVAESEKGYVEKLLMEIKKKGANAARSYKAPDREITWNVLYKRIAAKFNKDIAQENVLWAKVSYYDFYKDVRTKAYFIQLIKKYGTERLQMKQGVRDGFINYIAWQYGVISGNDRNDNIYLANLLKEAINRIEQKKLPGECSPHAYIDTYARLIYKIGEKEEAIKNQKYAISIYLNCSGGKKDDDTYQVYSSALSQMENGEELVNP